LSTKPKLLLIDDGLSYLNQNLKEYWINWIKKEMPSNCTVIWFTSDYNDLTFGDISWMLSLSDFSKISSLPFEDLSYNYNHPSGRLRLMIDNISFAYDDSDSPVINNWSCNINHARSIGLIGENGKGKTTLSQLITKILSLQSGSINLSIDSKNPSVAMLDQFPERMIGPESLENFISELISNEKLNPHLMKMCINKLKSSQINWDIIKNESAINIPWSTLRMAIIIILSYCNYDVLILDEPTFGMGIKQKLLLSKFLKEIIPNKYLILISHDVYFIESHCDHIYNLDQQVVSLNDRVLINA
jgi:ABC-type Mn2+/Zn2+ transport system ATPase subunit